MLFSGNNLERGSEVVQNIRPGTQGKLLRKWNLIKE